MRTLCLVLIGVVIGWPASGVDWTRDAVGEETDSITGKPILQYDGIAPLAEGRKIVLREIVDDKGVKHVVPEERVDSPLCEVGRYQLKVFGNSVTNNGYYVIDTLAGRVWYGAGGGRPQLLVGELPQQ